MLLQLSMRWQPTSKRPSHGSPLPFPSLSPAARVLAAATTGSGRLPGSAAAKSAAATCRLPAVPAANCSSSFGSATARTAAGRRRRCWRRRGGRSGAAGGCRPTAPPSRRCWQAAGAAMVSRKLVLRAGALQRHEEGSPGIGRGQVLAVTGAAAARAFHIGAPVGAADGPTTNSGAACTPCMRAGSAPGPASERGEQCAWQGERTAAIDGRDWPSRRLEPATARSAAPRGGAV